MTKKNETALVLRVCRADLTSHDGFQWPSEVGATVSAPDWKPIEECGNGLHGWLYGAGDHACVDFWTAPDAKWLVLEVAIADLVMLGGKVKFPSAIVRFIGDKNGAAGYLLANDARAKSENCIGASIVVGEKQVAAVGALGTATAGDRGTATAGDSGELRIRWCDYKNDRYRTEIAYVGENGIKPNVAYRLDDAHKFVEARP